MKIYMHGGPEDGEYMETNTLPPIIEMPELSESSELSYREIWQHNPMMRTFKKHTYKLEQYRQTPMSFFLYTTNVDTTNVDTKLPDWLVYKILEEYMKDLDEHFKNKHGC